MRFANALKASNSYKCSSICVSVCWIAVYLYVMIARVCGVRFSLITPELSDADC